MTKILLFNIRIKHSGSEVAKRGVFKLSAKRGPSKKGRKKSVL